MAKIEPISPRCNGCKRIFIDDEYALAMGGSSVMLCNDCREKGITIPDIMEKEFGWLQVERIKEALRVVQSTLGREKDAVQQESKQHLAEIAELRKIAGSRLGEIKSALRVRDEALKQVGEWREKYEETLAVRNQLEDSLRIKAITIKDFRTQVDDLVAQLRQKSEYIEALEERLRNQGTSLRQLQDERDALLREGHEYRSQSEKLFRGYQERETKLEEDVAIFKEQYGKVTDALVRERKDHERIENLQAHKLTDLTDRLKAEQENHLRIENLQAHKVAELTERIDQQFAQLKAAGEKHAKDYAERVELEQQVKNARARLEMAQVRADEYRQALENLEKPHNTPENTHKEGPKVGFYGPIAASDSPEATAEPKSQESLFSGISARFDQMGLGAAPEKSKNAIPEGAVRIESIELRKDGRYMLTWR